MPYEQSRKVEGVAEGSAAGMALMYCTVLYCTRTVEYGVQDACMLSTEREEMRLLYGSTVLNSTVNINTRHLPEVRRPRTVIGCARRCNVRPLRGGNTDPRRR
jgi:hypothetical protein